MADPRPALPDALATLKELPPAVVADQRSFCSLHGPQVGGNCPLCDEHFPEAVQARQVAVSQPTGFSMDQVQKMIADATKAAVAEAMAFERWKASPEGQAAAAAAQTAGVVPPQHGPLPGDAPSGPVSV